MAFTFEKLLVYQKAIDFADKACQISENFARGYGFLAEQLNRASLSIAANIAEGNGRFTKPDRKTSLESLEAASRNASRFWNSRNVGNSSTKIAMPR
jgi:hypothetical protein